MPRETDRQGMDTDMDKDQDTRLPLTSADSVGERMDGLRELFPEAFAEGKVDFEKLKQALGEFTDDSPERYGLSWAGKSEAKRAFQSLSSGTLAPVREQSVNFDTTENLIIEGDNLEVLKLLQQPYHGKVKMIYIDPPYNTGGDFIYPDNYHEGLDGYLRYSGQMTDEGMKIETNTESNGRFHSKWLSMMYPRLYLARNLLRDDGVIFVSIDDGEVHGLCQCMNEVFGEEHHRATFVWQKKDTPSNDTKGVSVNHEYIVCYARSEEFERKLLPRTEEQLQNYANPDDDPRGIWIRTALTRKEFVERDFYPIKNPQGREILPPKGTSWRVSRKTLERLTEDNRLWWGRSQDGDMPFQKRFLSEVQEGVVPTSWWDYRFAGSNRNAKMEMRALFDDPPFDTPKPTKVISRLLSVATEGEGIVLDFFAGSGTTAHAVLELNKEDGGNRNFILVQLPEPTGRADYPTIAEICRERVRRVIKKVNEEDNGKLDMDEASKPDRGFRALRLTSSNFKLWNADTAPTDGEGLAEQLSLYADHLLPGRSQEDILYELLLKAGVSLGAKIAKVDVAGRTAFDVSDGLLLICLEDEVTEETLRAMIERKPTQVLCLDNAFKGNDQLKTNTVLDMKSHDITFHTV